jgi:ABC-2 type transport system permease protein
MKTIHEIRLLFWRKMLETLREPSWVIAGLSTPLLYLLLFTPLLKGINSSMFGTGKVLDVFVPGILALMAFGAGMGAGWVVIWELQSGVIERLRVTPSSRFALLMGGVLRDIVMFIVPAILVIFTASLFGFHIHWAGLAILIILLSLLTAIASATSVSLGLIFKNIGSLAAVVTSLQLPITLLAGVLLPLSVGPRWLNNIAHFNPMFYAVEASRVLVNGTINSSIVLQAFMVIVPLTALVLYWATGIYRKAVS